MAWSFGPESNCRWDDGLRPDSAKWWSATPFTDASAAPISATQCSLARVLGKWLACSTRVVQLTSRRFGATSIKCWLISFFFNDTATTEIYTLSLHDALPI